jgi:Mlc titration factor MtfA (ptsG expression regulator)
MVARDHTDAAGVVHHSRTEHAGESWSEGQVVLSWDDTRHSAAVPDDGYNVVFHEFAHQLQQAGVRPLSGRLGTSPRPALLASPAAQAAWAATLENEYHALCQRLAAHAGAPPAEHEELLDPYAASAPEEFFAVATEVFFEQAQALRAQHPPIYAALVALYGVAPAEW